MTSREDWQRRLGPLYGGAVALVHSTPIGLGELARDDARQAGWLVALGVPIGLAAWAAAWLARGAGLAAPIAAILGLAVLTVLSAALPERGLAERIDGWLDQPHSHGGVVAISLLVVLRAVCIAFVAPENLLAVFLATAVTGRFAAVFLQALGDAIHDSGDHRSLVATPAPAWLVAALGIGTTVLAVLALGKAGVAAMAIAAVIAFVLGVDAQRRDHGLSAPVVGCAAAIAELLLLLFASAH